MNINKTFLINLIAFTLVGLSFMVPQYKGAFLYTGLFALSGALTNQLAIYMLFEKVPFLYGSGVITERFDAIKKSIKELIMNEFFTKEQLDNFFAKEEQKIDLTPLIEKADFTPAFDALSKTVMESSFGGMLGMFGGESALNTLKEPFVNKLKAAVLTIVNSQAFNDMLKRHLQSSSLNNDLLASIEKVIDARLDELTPKMVKDIVENMIREHLDWLVVWGGVFGGALGLVSSFII